MPAKQKKSGNKAPVQAKVAAENESHAQAPEHLCHVRDLAAGIAECDARELQVVGTAVPYGIASYGIASYGIASGAEGHTLSADGAGCVEESSVHAVASKDPSTAAQVSDHHLNKIGGQTSRCGCVWVCAEKARCDLCTDCWCLTSTDCWCSL